MSSSTARIRSMPSFRVNNEQLIGDEESPTSSDPCMDIKIIRSKGGSVMYIIEVNLIDNSVSLLLAYRPENFQKNHERRRYAVHVPVYDDDKAIKIRNLLIEELIKKRRGS